VRTIPPNNRSSAIAGNDIYSLESVLLPLADAEGRIIHCLGGIAFSPRPDLV
jgi:hypothetical protein